MAIKTDSGNTVTISDQEHSAKKIEIEIPADTVDSKLREQLDTIQHEASLPGFRKGHAPRRLIEKRFASSVRSETKNQLVASAYQEVIEREKLQVVGEPEAPELAEQELEEGKAFTFHIVVEVAPEFEMPELEGLKVYKPAVEVSDEMVDAEVEKITINEGELEEQDTPAAGDYLTGHAVMTGGSDNEEFYNIDGAVIQIPTDDKDGKGMILGIVVEDFAKQVGTPKVGDELTITAKGPEQHEVEGVRNADLKITFKVSRADRIVAAKLEDLLPRIGMESEDQLKDAIKGRIEQRAAQEQRSLMHQQIARHLVESVEIDLPERLSATQASRNLSRRRMELMQRGAEPEAIEEHIAELRSASSATAVNDLKLFFILNKAAETTGVNVSEEEINGQIAQMAIQRGQRPEKLREEIIKTNQVSALFTQIREAKTMDTILSKAEVEDVSADEFAEKMKALTKDD